LLFQYAAILLRTFFWDMEMEILQLSAQKPSVSRLLDRDQVKLYETTDKLWFDDVNLHLLTMMQIAITALNSKRAYRTFFFIVSA
jgi:hypothetical protein